MQLQLLWVVDSQAGVEGLLHMLLVVLLLARICWKVFVAKMKKKCVAGMSKLSLFFDGDINQQQTTFQQIHNCFGFIYI
jgi:hypothetical protein